MKRILTNITLVVAVAVCGILRAEAIEPVPDSILNHPEFPEEIALRKALESTHILTAGSMTGVSRDSMNRLISTFYVDQYRHFQDPRAPYFLYMSKDANLAMGVGGVIRMRGWYDWGGSIPANGFAPYLIPIPKNPAQDKRLAATPAGCSIFLTILGRKTPLGNIMGFVHGGFDGYNNINFKLKKAYVIINDWTIGYATSTFIDPATQPPTIDGSGPNGFTSKTQVLVRYYKTWRDRWSIGAGVEMPTSQADDDNEYTEKTTEYIPDIAVLGQYQWDRGLSHVRLSGLLHFTGYRNLLTGKNHNLAGLGVQLSSVIKVLPKLNFFGQAIFGRGISSYMSDLSIYRFELVPEVGKPGVLYSPEAFGYTLGLEYYFRPNLYACAVFGQLRYLPNTNPRDASYKYGMYSAVNLFYDLTSRFQLGIEYLHGRRMNFDHTHGDANRIDALFQFSF